jgi:hypothetical protein
MNPGPEERAYGDRRGPCAARLPSTIGVSSGPDHPVTSGATFGIGVIETGYLLRQVRGQVVPRETGQRPGLERLLAHASELWSVELPWS